MAFGVAVTIGAAGCGSNDSSPSVVAGAEAGRAGQTTVAATSGEAIQPVGSTDVVRFWAEVRALPVWEVTRLAPPPGDPAEAVARCSLVVKARVARTEIVTSTWSPDPALESSLGRVLVRVHLDIDEVLLGRGAEPGGLVLWDIEAWAGDPAVLDAAREDVQQLVEGSPVGATAVVFLKEPASARADGSVSWFAVDGLLADDSGQVRAVIDDASPVPQGYSSMVELVTAVEGLAAGESR